MGPSQIHCPLKPYLSPLPAGITPIRSRHEKIKNDFEWQVQLPGTTWEERRGCELLLSKWLSLWVSTNCLHPTQSTEQKDLSHSFSALSLCMCSSICPSPINGLSSIFRTQIEVTTQGGPSRFLVLSRFSDFIHLQRFILFLSKCTAYNHIPSYLIVCSMPDPTAPHWKPHENKDFALISTNKTSKSNSMPGPRSGSTDICFTNDCTILEMALLTNMGDSMKH